MIYAAIAIAALLSMRLIRYVTPGAAAVAAPALLLMIHAWSRTALSALGVWIAAAIVAALLWRQDRG